METRIFEKLDPIEGHRNKISLKPVPEVVERLIMDVEDSPGLLALSIRQKTDRVLCDDALKVHSTFR